MSINIFDVVGNDTRRSILQILSGEDKDIFSHENALLDKKGIRLSLLAKSLDISIPGLQKHIKILTSSSLVEKTAENRLRITSIGYATMVQLASIEFLQSNRDTILQDHALHYLPRKFIHRLADIQDHEVIIGTVANIPKYDEFSKEAQDWIKFISAQVSIDLYSKNFPLFKKNGIHIQYILGEDTIVPKGWRKLARKVGEPEMVSKGKLQKRMLKTIYYMLFVSDKNALVMLPDYNGTVDVNLMLASRHKDFRDWANDLFEHYWSKAMPFVESKLRES